jgi:alkylation response protein AidB-like acyl-CoA dehydrogenase
VLEELLGAVEAFAARRVRAGAIDRNHRIPPALLGEMAETGLFALAIPTRFGGLGLDLASVCAVVTTLARHDRAVATTVGLHNGLGTRAIVVGGTSAIQERVLPEMAGGQRIGAFACTEPGAGSDLSALRTRAIATQRGLQVDGSKIFVTNGGIAGAWTVAAASPGLGGARRGHSLVLLLREDAGITVGNEEDKLGLRGSSTTSLHLDGVEVPGTRILGVPGQGMAGLDDALAWGRAVLAAGSLGTAQAAWAAARTHVGQRRQFGRTLDQLEVVRAQLATMAALLASAETVVARAAASTGPELARRAAVAKVLASEAAWEVVDAAVQLHGGSGCIEETGLPLLLRDARVTRIFEGANDVLRVRLGLGEALEPSDGSGPLAEETAEFRAALVRRHGVRIGHADLHRLGGLVVLRDACIGLPNRGAGALWTVIARARARQIVEPPPPAELVEGALA